MRVVEDDGGEDEDVYCLHERSVLWECYCVRRLMGAGAGAAWLEAWPHPLVCLAYHCVGVVFEEQELRMSMTSYLPSNIHPKLSHVETPIR